MIIIFKVLAPKYLNKVFLVPNLGIFVFFAKLCNWKNISLLISNVSILFSNSNKAFLVLNLGILFFAKLHNSFSKFYPKITQKGIFCPKFRGFFCFFTRFYDWANSRVLILNVIMLFLNSNRKIPK